MQINRNRSKGVTLLEVLLVFAIVALVVIMAVRYYRANKVSQDANTVMQLISTIQAAADDLAVGISGSNYSKVTLAKLRERLGSAAVLSPVTGAPITFALQGPASSPTGYRVTIGMTPSACAIAQARLQLMNGFKTPAPSCATNGNLTYTYNKTQD